MESRTDTVTVESVPVNMRCNPKILCRNCAFCDGAVCTQFHFKADLRELQMYAWCRSGTPRVSPRGE